MAPSVLLDTTSDFKVQQPKINQSQKSRRTLLLAPPSVSAHPEALQSILEAHDRNATDIQMLDRLAMGLVSLPQATYEVVMLLTDVQGASTEISRLLDRNVMEKLFDALQYDGRLISQNGQLDGSLKTEAVLAGLRDNGDGSVTKPAASSAPQTVQLSFGKRKKADAAATPANEVEAINVGKRKIDDTMNGTTAAPAVVQVSANGVGFIDTNDDYEDEYDDEDEDMEIPSNAELMQAGSLDPNTFLTEDDLKKPIIVPENCKPNSKRRRACKDCTCGLAQRLEAEDKAKRSQADVNLAKLSSNDLNEMDFTVQGKVGSCGNCALGDAFRCDGCPYIGLPAFKPGEEVRLLNNDVQL